MKPDQQSRTASATCVALVYARLSIVKNERDQISPERQVVLCSEVAHQHGWTVETYVDAEGHRSGGSEKHRPEWRRLKAQLARPDVTAVIVADFSRASRSRTDFFNFLDECEKRGKKFISVKDGFDTSTAMGRALVGFIANMNAWRREIDSENALVAINFKRDAGKHVGNVPFGAKRDDKGVLVKSDDWPVCETVLHSYATGSYSLYNLAVFLNADPRGLRFRNRLGECVPFDRWSVRSIISNVLTYAGYIVRGHGKDMSVPWDLHGDDFVEALVQRVGAIKAQHEPFISREMAERIVRVRVASLRPHVAREKRHYILVPILHCANCGRPLRGSFVKGVPCYIHRPPVCQRRAGLIVAEVIEKRVVVCLRAIRLTPQRREELRRRVEERLRIAPGSEDVKASIEKLEQQGERAKDLYIQGDLKRAEYDERKQLIARAVQELQAKLGPQLVNLDAIFEQLDTIACVLERGTPMQQRRALSDLFERIDVDFSGSVRQWMPKAWAKALFSTKTGGAPEAQRTMLTLAA